MTIELQQQITASSVKIDNWQDKKRGLEKKHFDLTNHDLNFDKNKVANVVDKLHSKLDKTKEGIYKFIEAL
jgi:hypothetical protein